MTAGTKLKILVVEDEILIRLDTVEILQDAGFEMFEAGSADDALAILDKVKDIAVVFTDVNMPGNLDGMQIAREIAKTRPEIGIVITSGKVRPASGELPPRSLFVTKPYDFNAVIKCIEAVSAK